MCCQHHESVLLPYWLNIGVFMSSAWLPLDFMMTYFGNQLGAILPWAWNHLDFSLAPTWLHLAWWWSWWNSWNPNIPNLMASWKHTTSPNSKPWQFKKSINSKIPHRTSPNIKEPKIWIVSVTVKIANAKNFKVRYIQNSGFPSGALFKASPKNENAENLRNLVTGKIKNAENLRNRHIQNSGSPRGPP